MGHVIDVLRGSKKERIMQLGHNRLSTYGIGADRSQEYWGGLLHHLVHGGFLQQDVGNYSVLTLTDAAGRPAGRTARDHGGASRKARRHSENHPPHERRSGIQRGALPEAPDPAEKLADAAGVPPFVVFSDVSLRGWPRNCPKDDEAFLNIHGVGAHKLERYGEQFLARYGSIWPRRKGGTIEMAKKRESAMPGSDHGNPMRKETIGYEAHGNLYSTSPTGVALIAFFASGKAATGSTATTSVFPEPSEEEIRQELENLNLATYKEVVFTGFGEPTCRFDTVIRLTQWLHQRGIPVRLDTNGHAALIRPGRDVVAELKAAGLTALSVSLNAESEEKYNRLCRPVFEGSYQAMLDFTKKAIMTDIRTRMTIVGQQSIDVEECERIAAGLGASFRVR